MHPRWAEETSFIALNKLTDPKPLTSGVLITDAVFMTVFKLLLDVSGPVVAAELSVWQQSIFQEQVLRAWYHQLFIELGPAL